MCHWRARPSTRLRYFVFVFSADSSALHSFHVSCLLAVDVVLLAFGFARQKPLSLALREELFGLSRLQAIN